MATDQCTVPIIPPVCMFLRVCACVCVCVCVCVEQKESQVVTFRKVLVARKPIIIQVDY